MNEKFSKAVSGRPQKVPPIWMMRQAGRYHKHYQRLKEKYTFLELCKTPELAAEVALGPIQDFDFDVAILFSDLLFPLEALGFGLDYAPGPVLDRRLSLDVIQKFRSLPEALSQLEFQRLAMRCTREVLPKDKSLIGFIGGPWTLFTYALEHGHTGHLFEAKSSSSLFVEFQKSVIPLLRENIRLQLEGGAEVVMILDTAAGELSPTLFRAWLQEDIVNLCRTFPGQVGYYSKGTNLDHVRELMGQDVVAGFGFDHRVDLPGFFGHCRGFLQGNFDQVLLFSEGAEFGRRLDEFLEPFKNMPIEKRRGWVCGLGHGVLPKTPEINVKRCVERVREVLDHA